MPTVRAEAGGGGRRLTRYTVMGWSCLKVRLRAGLELYLHLDSTKRSSASLAWSSDTAGTLGGHARPGSVSDAPELTAASPDVGHQGVPVGLGLGDVGGGGRVQRGLVLWGQKDTGEHRPPAGRPLGLTCSCVSLIALDGVQPAGRGRRGALFWDGGVKGT